MTPDNSAELARQIAQMNDLIERAAAMVRAIDEKTGVESLIHKALVDEIRTTNIHLERLCGGVERLVDELTPKKKTRAGLTI